MEKLQPIGETILNVFSQLIDFGNTYIGTYLLIVLLLIAGLYFSFKTNYSNYQYFNGT